MKEYEYMLNRYIYILLLTLIFFACKKENGFRGIEDKFFEYQEMGWKSNSFTYFINGINYTATEVPLEYYLLKNESGSKIDSIYKLHHRERIIEFEFQQEEKKDLLLEKYTNKDYKKSVEYLSFTIKNDFQVITCNTKDTITCSGVLFERNYKIAPFKRLLLYFYGVEPDDTIKLLYDDQLFGNGLIKFNFSKRPVKL